MQSPTIVFDHIDHVVLTVTTRPEDQRRLADMIEAQRNQVTTSGRASS